MWVSLSMDSLPKPTQCQGQRAHYVTDSFWWLWSLTGELLARFSVSITQFRFKRNLKTAEVLLASCFTTGRLSGGFNQKGFSHIFIQTFMTCLFKSGSGIKQLLRFLFSLSYWCLKTKRKTEICWPSHYVCIHNNPQPVWWAVTCMRYYISISPRQWRLLILWVSQGGPLMFITSPVTNLV